MTAIDYLKVGRRWNLSFRRYWVSGNFKSPFHLLELLLQLLLLLAQLADLFAQLADFLRHERRLVVELGQRALRCRCQHLVGVVGGVLAAVAFSREFAGRIASLQTDSERLLREEPLLPLAPASDELGLLGTKLREVWAPAYKAKGDQFPVEVANRLLEASQDSKLGGWTKQGRFAVFVVKLPTDASVEQLDDANDAAIQSADQMEAELTPDKDEF